jgi:hypothetical protein
MNMKKIAMLSALMVLSLSAYALAGDQDFVLVNETGLTIDQFYCSPTTTDDWEEDVLGVETLADGDSIEINFDREEDACGWDLKIVDEEGDEIVWQKIDLCKATFITLYYKDGKPTADIELAE